MKNLIGHRIKLARKKKILSQQDVAKSIGTSASYISEIENGKKIPGGEFLLSLKQILNVSVDWILTGDEEDQVVIDDTDRTVIDLQHEEIVGRFSDKKLAKNANVDLLEIEKIDRETFVEVVGYIRGVAAGLKRMAADISHGVDRRGSVRRSSSDPSMAPDGTDRRMAGDRRKASGGRR